VTAVHGVPAPAAGGDPDPFRGILAARRSRSRYPAAAASVTNYTVNTLNQYTAIGTSTLAYDGNGNLANDGTYSYCYDAENRLTRIVSGTCVAPTGTIATYGFDAQGRRKTKTVGGTTTVLVTDADNREVLEYDGTSGLVLEWYAFGLGPDEALSQMNVESRKWMTVGWEV
jgi:YD repeat-containing protein